MRRGFSRYVGLPEIIVCGDQAAGKSSVLEAISGMRFPARDGLCTRFATELVLRRGHETSTKVFITPGEGRYDEEKKALERWQPRASIEKDGLEVVTEEALSTMEVPTARRFYDDILRIELTGPEQPHLTMVDLPGLFRAGNKEQLDTDVDTVRSMVEKYMARPRSIILAVVSAKNEYVLKEVTSMAKYADPEGATYLGADLQNPTPWMLAPIPRDIGCVSPRTPRWTSVSDGMFLGTATLSSGARPRPNATPSRRISSQGAFGPCVNPSHCSVEALRIRLSSVLKDQILSQLPGPSARRRERHPRMRRRAGPAWRPSGELIPRSSNICWS